MSRRLGLAALAFALLVVYASLVPLDEHTLTARGAWSLLASSWPPRMTSKSDVVANLLLQFPLGFLLTGALTLNRSGRRGTAVLLATTAVAALAFAIEFAQGMFSARTPSATDVVAETIGAFGGALVWTLSGAWLTNFTDERWMALGSPALLVLGAYACAWTLWQWMPFDFTLRPAELAQKYRAGLMVLWPGAPGAEGFAITLGRSARNWLLALPVGALAWLLTRRRRVRRLDAAVLVGCGATCAVQLGNFATLSRGVDLGTAAAAGLGAATGVWWAEGRARTIVALIGVAAVLALALDQWAPFRVSGEPQAFAVAPFVSYLMARPSQAVSEAVLKLQLGFALAFVSWRAEPRTSIMPAIRLITICAIVEAGQVFLPGRFADVTDLLFLSAGTLVGLRTREIFQRERTAYQEGRAAARPRRASGASR